MHTAEGNFLHLAEPPEQTPGSQCTAEKFLLLVRALCDTANSNGSAQNVNSPVDHLHKSESSLVTHQTHSYQTHLPSRCMVGSAKKSSFVALFCLSACARLLVHVGFPLRSQTDKPKCEILDVSNITPDLHNNIPLIFKEESKDYCRDNLLEWIIVTEV